ncbi:patatin-like phospholipase family protein [Mesorhizobium sp. B4-1-1]|nr:patatin-like phospholipase family protein [Mesorhizobium sp. B4-1-1]
MRADGNDKLSKTRGALILAGGGYVASSWEIGLVTGMADSGLDVRDTDLLVGTSAGARVAVDLTSGRSLKEFYQQRVGPDGPSLEQPPQIDWARIRAGVDDARQSGGSPTEILRRYGQLALVVGAGTASDRRATVSRQLSSRTWPKQRVLIPAVNAETGERRAFDRESGIDLVDAIIATTASFGSPAMFFDGHHYIDGGYYSSDNADLAIGYERILILALRSPPQAMRVVPVEAGVDILRAAGAQVEVIHPDEETMAALAPTGGQMNPASGKPAAIAGRLQGQRCANEHLLSFWG